MLQVADITGQSRLLSEIHHVLWARERPAIRICGPSGSGKSWVAERVADRWRDGGDVAFVAPGDELFRRRPHFPLLYAVSSETGSARAKAVAKLALEPVGVIPLGGKPLREILLQLFERSDAETATKTPFLRQDDREIFMRIQKAASQRRVLLICDNLQWFDDASLEVLGLALSSATRTAFPFLENLALMALETRSETGDPPPELRSLFAATSWQTYQLSPPSSGVFPDLLRAFGVRSSIPSEVLARLYAITGGHLELVRRIAEADASTSQGRVWDGAEGRATFLFNLLEERLERTAAMPEETAAVLRAASVIGASFAEHELKCILHEDPAHLVELLEPAERLRLLERSGSIRMFAHDLVHAYFLQHAKTRREELHGRFSDCLRLVHSGDYARRAEHLRRANNRRAAGEVLVLETLRKMRAGVPPPMELLRPDLDGDLLAFMGRMIDAQAQFDRGAYRPAAQALDGIESLLADVLLAERDILLARCHIKLLTHADRTQAKLILSRWERLRDSESEVWSRVMLYLTVANVFLGDELGAKETERALYQHLAARVSYDPTARTSVNHLRLKSNMLHSAQVARARLREAVEFFSGAANAALYDPVHQYIGLANLAANYLTEGEFEEGFAACDQANAVVEREPSVTFPRPDILLTNLTVAGFGSGRIALADAVDAAQSIWRSGREGNDGSLLASNVAYYLAHQHRHEEAIALLDPVFQGLLRVPDNDPYYTYYAGNNLAGSLFMRGRVTESRAVWDTITPQIQAFIGPLAPYVRRRHELQAAVFNTETAEQDWDGYLSRTVPPQVGPGWRLYGRGFLPSELEFWSDE